jgi:hypothetical protein
VDDMANRPGKSEAVAAQSTLDLSRGKRAYMKPRLRIFGRLAQITHGPTAGLGESGNPFLFKSQAG